VSQPYPFITLSYSSLSSILWPLGQYSRSERYHLMTTMKMMMIVIMIIMMIMIMILVHLLLRETYPKPGFHYIEGLINWVLYFL